MLMVFHIIVVFCYIYIIIIIIIIINPKETLNETRLIFFFFRTGFVVQIPLIRAVRKGHTL